MDPTFFEVTRTGEVLSRLTTDTTLVQSIAGVNLSITLRSTIQLIGALVLLVATSPSLAGMILVLIPFIIAPLVGVLSTVGMLVTIAVSAALMFAFELLIVYKLWLSTREFARVTRDINTTLAGLGLDHWSLSTVDLEGDRLLRVSSLGLREGRSVEEADRDLHVDAVYPIDGFPLTEQTVRECGWFTATADESSCDPGERAVLAELGRRFVVALGWVDSGEGLLLEVYGNHGDPRAVGAAAALGAAAVAGAPLLRTRPTVERTALWRPPELAPTELEG